MSTVGDESPSVDENAPNRSGLGAPKNKQCPFCHESFTSSSLGRHLDLYIREKNPKSADGLHDVDKIHEIRSAITRRQPRRSTRAFDSANAPNASISQADNPHNNLTSPYGLHTSDKKSKWAFNKPTWEATGVITDLQPTPTLGMNHNLQGNSSRNGAVLRKRMAEDRTRLRAAELALQELLDSVNAAQSDDLSGNEQDTKFCRIQAYPSTPYHFDFLSQTFPGLCLKLLQQQPSLQSVQVIENPRYCPVGPPNQRHYELLKQLLKGRLDEFASTKERSGEIMHSLGRGTSTSNNHAQPDKHDESIYTAHLIQAWDVWKSTSESQKATQWHLEVLRALSNSQAEQKGLSNALDRAKAEKEHLKIQIERLNECQQPKEFTYQIPSNWHVTKETASTLVSLQVDTPPDREVLINKWTTVVRRNSKFQRALPDIGLVDISTDIDGMYMDSHDLNGTQEDEDGESEDAAGDEDDEDASGEKDGFDISRDRGIDTSFMDRDMLDPGLRGEGDMDVDEGGYGAEMLLATRVQRGKDYELQ